MTFLRPVFVVASALIGLSAAGLQAQECAHAGDPAGNIALAKGFYAAFNTKQKALLNTALAEAWVDIPMAPGQGPGREGMKAAMDGYYQAFPDFHAENEDFIAAGDKVVVRSTITATQRGGFAGVAATGKPIRIMAVDIHQICEGRIVKTWHVEDWLSGLFEMGALPPKS